MQRFIAIDNVCAWPNLTLLPSGEIIATIFNQPCHGAWEGDVECWASGDGGERWTYRGTPAPHEPGKNRMNVSAGLARNGDMVVIASGWSDRVSAAEFRAGKRTEFDRSRVLEPWVCRSADAGRTWTISKNFPKSLDEKHCEPIPFGDILLAADGSLCTCAYAGLYPEPSDVNSAYFYRSRDDGKSWEKGVHIGRADYNETTPLHLGGGRWLAASRTHRVGALDLFRSDDDGATWRRDQPLAFSRQHPAGLLRLADGRVLVTYGNRCANQQGVDCRFSTDEGKSWSAPLRIVDIPDTDLGYPSTVQRADGTMVTAYYAGRSPHHGRYHMGVAIWTPKELIG